MIRSAFYMLWLWVFLSCQPQNKSKIILAILAHPDDESAVGQVLAKYASQGHKVHLLITCDGRYGVEEHAGIPAGDTLAEIRKKESVCACEKLGIEPPIFLGAHDGLGMFEGVGPYFGQTIPLKQKIKEQITAIQPTAILTFGPDGDTGHADHRAISAITTEVILSEGWYDTYPLYYIAWPKEKIVSIPQGQMSSLNYVDEKYLNVRIQYTEADRSKLFESLNCYKSQFTPSDVQEWIDAELKDSTFTFYFRKFTLDSKMATDF